MISVIIPLFNGQKTISRTLNSIIEQLPESVEVIVVNDGSTDASAEEVRKHDNNFTQKGVRLVLINKKNGGAPSARNLGVTEAKGEYLFFCDDDAWLEPGALQEMRKTLENNPTKSYAYSAHFFGKKLLRSFPFSAQKMRQMPYIHTMALIRRSDFPKAGWDESIKKFQDWDLWLTMLAEGKEGIWIDKVLFRVGVGEGRTVMSLWLPSFAYKLLPFLPSVKKYKNAMAIIKKKHNLI